MANLIINISQASLALFVCYIHSDHNLLNSNKLPLKPLISKRLGQMEPIIQLNLILEQSDLDGMTLISSLMVVPSEWSDVIYPAMGQHKIYYLCNIGRIRAQDLHKMTLIILASCCSGMAIMPVHSCFEYLMI